MRRPLCVFCATFLLTQVAIIYLPQNFCVILAAIFTVGALVYFACKRHGYSICVFLGVVIGLSLFSINQARQLNAVAPYLDQTVTLTARVESPSTSYIEGMVNATLQVDSINGQAASFACYAVLLPETVEGQFIQGDFIITALTQESNLLMNYSNGVFAAASYVDCFSLLGNVGGVRGFFIAAQESLSRIIRIPFSAEIGGVIAAMTIGDRNYVPNAITALYRKAGLSHVLVVSGLHLSLICSMVLIQTDKRHKRILKAILTMSLALLLAGITGASASILRAVFVLVMCTVATLVDERADSFTSLAVAGFALVCANGYAVCNLSFQLSFLATFGVLLGASFAKKTKGYLAAIGFSHVWVQNIYTSLVITTFATAATFPVLVLWGMNVSMLAFFSNILTVWMIPFILIFGLLGALIGLLPFCGFISTLFLTTSAIFVGGLNIIVEKVATLPGAQLYFETDYAAIVCAIVLLVATVAYLLHLRYRVAMPCVLVVLFVGVFIGNYFTKDIIKVAMVGTSSYPAIIISQNDTAIVLFRGGEYNTQTVEDYLEKRGIEDVQLLIDLRADPSTTSELPSAEESIWLYGVDPFSDTYFTFGEADGIIFNAESGGAVVLDLGGVTVATTSGSVVLSELYVVDVLLSTSSSSGSVVGEILLCRNMSNSDFENYAANMIYYGKESAALWVRYGGDYQLMGVEHGE